MGKLEYYDVFKAPFKADENCCYIWCNGGTQVCFDVMDERDAKLGERIADCLNYVHNAKGFDDIGISADGQYICDGHTPLLCVRGWGMLTGTGGYNLSAEEAARLQDDFVKFAASRLGYRGDNQKSADESRKQFNDEIKMLREQIAKLQSDTMDENKNFRSSFDEGRYDALSEVDCLLDSMDGERLECIEKEVAESFVSRLNRKRTPIVLRGEKKAAFENEFNTLWQTINCLQFAHVAKHIVKQLCLDFAAWGANNLKDE